MSKQNKPKKEKVIYYDDNSTISDMSRVTKGRRKPDSKSQKSEQYTMTRTTSKWRTYWSAVKMMLIPMFVVLGVLCVLFFFLMLIGGNLG